MDMATPFGTTIWSSIRLAKDGHSTALNEFVLKYRDPIVTFIRAKGQSPEDAEDLAQEVFMIVFRDRLLAKAEEARGRFRSFLLGIVKNVLSNADRIRTALKRGGGRREVSLDAVIGDDLTLGKLLEGREEDDAFDREWTHHLIHLAIDQLRVQNPRYHQAMELRVDGGLSHAEIAQRLGVETKQVDNLLQQAKVRMGELVRAEISSYCSSPGELEEEMSHLVRYITAV